MADMGSVSVNRVFEQPAEAVSFYCDFVQISGTSSEVILQFYETIPGAPTPVQSTTGIAGMAAREARTRLRATVFVHPSHAKTIARLLSQGGGLSSTEDRE